MYDICLTSLAHSFVFIIDILKCIKLTLPNNNIGTLIDDYQPSMCARRKRTYLANRFIPLCTLTVLNNNNKFTNYFR